ncbi:hypothetical protein HZH68_014994 [Vespula germanica]|uniref:Uncharacterized protein n=1 Tax=Vespula germanica TaxID=30212 RepID=A0A834MS38_VESGE|nr:hypothetical protein HZH68_014994 [Vespula germanica]
MSMYSEFDQEHNNFIRLYLKVGESSTSRATRTLLQRLNIERKSHLGTPLVGNLSVSLSVGKSSNSGSLRPIPGKGFTA